MSVIMHKITDTCSSKVMYLFLYVFLPSFLFHPSLSPNTHTRTPLTQQEGSFNEVSVLIESKERWRRNFFLVTKKFRGNRRSCPGYQLNDVQLEFRSGIAGFGNRGRVTSAKALLQKEDEDKITIHPATCTHKHKHTHTSVHV